MKMLRHYFISDSLDDLEKFEEELEARGVATQQIHVLSFDDTSVSEHAHLHAVQSFLKSDVVHSTARGVIVGVVLAALLLLVAKFAGWTQTAAGWMPFIFLAVVLLGFCTWEASFIGFQKPNHNYARFEQALKNGKHVFLVDLEPAQEATLEQLLKLHPAIELAGTGASAQHWLVALQQRLGIGRHSTGTT
jgi:hypothetical protein